MTVGSEAGKPFGQLEAQLDVVDPDRVRDQLERVTHDLVQVDPRPLGGPLAGEGQEVPNDAGAALSRVDHLHRAVGNLLVARGLEQGRVPGQDRERVVELVGDARQELAHRRQLFALSEVLLEAFALGDVLLDRDEVRDLALLVPNGRDRLLLGVEGAVLASVDDLAPPGLPGQDGLPQALVERRVVVARLEDT